MLGTIAAMGKASGLLDSAGLTGGGGGGGETSSATATTGPVTFTSGTFGTGADWKEYIPLILLAVLVALWIKKGGR